MAFTLIAEKISQMWRQRMGRPCIHIKASPVDWTSPLSSSFSGTPYLPKGTLYPASQINGIRYNMILLAQINFAEIPHLPSFPTSGILQIYSNPHNGSYGSDIKNPALQEHFCVLYHENVSMNVTELLSPPVFSAEDWNAMPISRPHQLRFTKGYSAPWAGETSFDQEAFFAVCKEIGCKGESYDELWEQEEQLMEEISGQLQNDGHRIGGYPDFVQGDPRYYDETLRRFDTLLLQMDTDDEIMWGDAGIANFFINAEDLAKKRFDRVLYHWDCG